MGNLQNVCTYNVQVFNNVNTNFPNRSHLKRARLGRREDAEHSLHLGHLDLVEQVVEFGHAAFPEVELRARAHVVRLLADLLCLRQNLS